MRTSQSLLATLKEIPADAEVISNQLMLRAGMIRKIAGGLYTWLPLGLKVLQKVERIVREEMNRHGAQEVLMPVVQPAELWEESGRWEQYGAELLRISDRHGRAFCLGPTHEEVITELARNELQSYKQLPQNFYQIQTKFRDEIRPRFGVMRSREFIMKDAYSFHNNLDCLENTYANMHAAYNAIFSRIGLEFRAVLADTGSIGGNASHEFHVLAKSGEDDIAFSQQSDYAANVELAEAVALPSEKTASGKTINKIATPDAKTIEEVCQQLNIEASNTVKTLIVKADSEYCQSEFIALVVRGDHTLNSIKAEKIKEVSNPLTFANDTDIEAAIGCSTGSIGPVKLNIPFIVDRTAANLVDFTCGANEDGFHLTNVNWGNDAAELRVEDIRCVVSGDPSPDGNGTLEIKRGIEVGHIFQLGKKYSEAMNASVLNENGKRETLFMGCYGIGVSRVVAATIEQNHDENGIIWPESIAPFQVAVIPLNMQKSENVASVTEKIYSELVYNNLEVLLDDRNERPGVKFADIELIGIPHTLVIGDKSLEKGVIEYRNRKTNEKSELPIDNVIDELLSKLKH